MKAQKYLGGGQSVMNQNWREIRDGTIRIRMDYPKREKRVDQASCVTK